MNKIAAFSGNSFFSLLLLRPLVEQNLLQTVIISKGQTSTSRRIIGLMKKMSTPYFIYRSTVSILSSLIPKASVISYCRSHRIPVKIVERKQDLERLTISNIETAVALNFDLIIPHSLLNKFPKGIMNVHASNLPRDKGISPVVWAFCRGDKYITSSIYYMDEGIDTGSIIEKHVIKIDPKWSLFKTYCEVLSSSGARLLSILTSSNHVKIHCEETPSISNEITESYNSWPSNELHAQMKKNRLSYFKFNDLCYLLPEKLYN